MEIRYVGVSHHFGHDPRARSDLHMVSLLPAVQEQEDHDADSDLIAALESFDWQTVRQWRCRRCFSPGPDMYIAPLL